MSETISIQSHAGPYEVRFHEGAVAGLGEFNPVDSHFLIDQRVAELHGAILDRVLRQPSVLLIDAVERNKSLERMPYYVKHLVRHSLRRGQRLIAIGGGITQDICCFLAATMLRGVDWEFFPTTLLAQADSCIGSKSSINCGDAKNILGTFTPPKSVHINVEFLATLEPRDLRSGLGEMLKVHAIDGPGSFDRIAADYDAILADRGKLQDYIRASLAIKKRYIEEDEFDRGPRNIFNYGHSFGHAIEAATDFSIPHGIAITIGMDMANHVAAALGIGNSAEAARMRPALRRNYDGFERHPIPMEPFLDALAKDKKNAGTGSVTLILPDAGAKLFKDSYRMDASLIAIFREYLERTRLQP